MPTTASRTTSLWALMIAAVTVTGVVGCSGGSDTADPPRPAPATTAPRPTTPRPPSPDASSATGSHPAPAWKIGIDLSSPTRASS